MELNKIKCVIVDFDGTLYSNGDYSTELSFFDKFIENDEFFKSKKIRARQLLDIYPEYHIIQAIYAFLHQNGIDDSNFRKYCNENIFNIIGKDTVFIDPDLLVRLSKKYEIYLISDSAKKYLEHYMDYAKIDKTILKRYLSNQYNDEKYSKRPMMDFVLKETGLKPNEIIMVGDSEMNDIEPAKEFGFQTCLVNGKEDTEKLIKKLLKL